MAIEGFVRYCPDLQLYHLVQKDDTKVGDEAVADYKFSDDELEDVVAFHLMRNNEVEAKFIVNVTGVARIHPHRTIDFSSEGKLEFRDEKPKVQAETSPEPKSETKKE